MKEYCLSMEKSKRLLRMEAKLNVAQFVNAPHLRHQKKPLDLRRKRDSSICN
jgi:hypothetical protein